MIGLDAKLNTENYGEILVAELDEDRLDAVIAPDFKKKIQGYIEEGRSFLVIDLSRVDFIDSTGLGSLVACLKIIKRNIDTGENKEIVLCGINQKVMPLFQLTRMDQIFNIRKDRDDALKFFHEK